MQLNSRKVLTVNQIVEILISYDATKNWESAFYKTIPQRKLNSDHPNKVGETFTTNNTNDCETLNFEDFDNGDASDEK
jgi:hypothetical protein